MASSGKNNTIDISLLFSANGADNYSGAVKQVSDALNLFNTVMTKTNDSMKEFSKMQKMINNSLKSNANSLLKITNSFGSVDDYYKAVQAQKDAMFTQAGGVQAKVDALLISNDRKSDSDYKHRQKSQDQYYSYMKDYFNNLADAEKNEYMADYYEYRKSLFKRSQLKLQNEEQNFLKQPLNSSFKESVKYALRTFEQRGRNQQGLSGFFSRTFGNSVKNTRFGDAFAAKDSSGNIIKGTGINMGLAVPAMAAVAIAKLSKVIYKLGKASVDAAKEIEAVKTQLGVIYGNKGEANTVFNEIANYAVKSPFSVQSTAEYATLLKQSGVYSKDLMDTLKMIGDVTGGNEEKMKRVANNYAQVQAATKASARDLREFAMAGIPIYGQIAKTLGKSVEEVKQMGSEGKISGEIIQQTFKNMTGTGGLFEGAIEEGAKTFKAREVNASDKAQLAANEIGQRYIIPYIAEPLLSIKESFFDIIYNGVKIKNVKTDWKKRKSEFENFDKQRIASRNLSGEAKFDYETNLALEKKQRERRYSEILFSGKSFYEEVMKPAEDELEEKKEQYAVIKEVLDSNQEITDNTLSTTLSFIEDKDKNKSSETVKHQINACHNSFFLCL